MKILFSSHYNPHFFTITEYIEVAIRQSVHDLIVFEDRRHIIPGRIRKCIPALDRLDLNVMNRELLTLVHATEPELAIVAGGHRIMPETVQHLKRQGVICILWTIDAPLYFKPIIDVAPSYDHIFCQGSEAVELLNNAGIKCAQWLPMACDSDYHHPVECTDEEKKTYGSDIVFVGSYYPRRAALFEPLAGLDFCDFSIWGPGWDTLPAASPLRKHIRGLHTRPDEWLRIYSASKIVLSVHYQDPQGKIPVYQASPRVFEVLACKAFQLCDDQRDVYDLFQDGHDLVKFTDGKDLVAKVQYYLAHPDERKRIAEQGRETVLARHTYQDRIRELLKKIGHES